MQFLLFCSLMLFAMAPLQTAAQGTADTGPQLPVILEWADSLVGSSPSGSVQREFIGHVRFRQGNVTVSCDRAIHDAAANAADLFGNVVVSQDSITMRAPFAHYDGNSFVASADRGVVVRDGHRRIESRRGTYSTKTHVAVFDDRVVVRDDTMTVWSDHAVYDRDSKNSTASGHVLLVDSIRRAVLQGDTLYHEPSRSYSLILGETAMWQWESDTVTADSIRFDTLLVTADTLEAFQGDAPSYVAQGNVAFVRGGVSARSDSLHYADVDGRFALFGMPILWADSMQLMADTIIVEAPKRTLRSIIGQNRSIMISKTDTTVQDRYDQVSGRIITIFVDKDTVRSLTSVDDARSITFRTEEGVRDGLAKFASDTIKAYFINGQPEDIYWLGGVEGEHHPEPVVAGNEPTYRLPGFEWRLDRPFMTVPLAPFQSREPRPARIPRADVEVSATTGKKK